MDRPCLLCLDSLGNNELSARPASKPCVSKTWPSATLQFKFFDKVPPIEMAQCNLINAINVFFKGLCVHQFIERVFLQSSKKHALQILNASMPSAKCRCVHCQVRYL